MKKKDFKKRRLSRWLVLLLFAVFIATGGMSSTAMAEHDGVRLEDLSTTTNYTSTVLYFEDTNNTFYDTGNLNVAGVTTMGSYLNMAGHSIYNINELNVDGFVNVDTNSNSVDNVAGTGVMYMDDSIMTIGITNSNNTGVNGISADTTSATMTGGSGTTSWTLSDTGAMLNDSTNGNVFSVSNTGNISAQGNLDVYGLTNDIGVAGSTNTLYGTTNIETLNVSDNATLGNATTDTIVINGTISSGVGSVRIGDSLYVTGVTSLRNDLNVDSDGAGANGSTLTVNETGVAALNSTGHGLTITSTETTLTGGTGTTSWTLSDTGAVLNDSTNGATFSVSNWGDTTAGIYGTSYNALYGYSNTLSAYYNYIYGDTYLSSYNGNTTMNLDDNGAVVYSSDSNGYWQMGVDNSSGMGSLGYSNSSNNTSSGLDVYATGGTFGYEDWNNGIYSGIATDQYYTMTGYLDNSYGIFSGFYADSGSTSVSYADFSSSSSVFGMYADGSSATFGYTDYVSGVDHGLGVYQDYTILTGGTNSSSLTLADDVATLAVGTASASEVTVLTASNDGTATEVNIVSDTLTVDSETSINNTLEVDSNGAAPNGNRLSVNDTNITLTSNAGSQIIVGNAANGVRLYSANDSERVGVNNNESYIGYFDSGNQVTGLQADASTVGVGYIYSDGSAYGMYAEDGGAYFGYDNGTLFHGLTVTSDTTTLSGGTNSSSLTLVDAAATLAVGTASTSEVTVLTATNDGSATDVTVSSDTLTVNSATTVNNSLLVDSNGTATAGGNTLSVDANGVSVRSDSNTFGMDVNNGVAQIGYQNGSLSNGLQATSGGVVLSSTNTAAYSSTVRLDETQAYISYNDGTVESGLEAGPGGLIVGSTDGTESLGMTTLTASNEVIVGYINGDLATGQAYGLHADDESVSVGYKNDTSFHGLEVTDSYTNLSGGTGTTDMRMDDNGVVFYDDSFTNADPDRPTWMTTNDANTTFAVDNTGNGYFGGDLDVQGTLTVGTFNPYDLDVENNLTVGNNTTLGDDPTTDTTTVNGSLAVNSVGPDLTSNLTVNGTSGVTAYAYDASGAAGMGLGYIPVSPTAAVNGAYIGFDNGTVMSGLVAYDGTVSVGLRDSDSNTQGLSISANTTSLVDASGHGLIIDSVNNTTTLSGGSNTSLWTMADSSASLAVGTVSSSGIDLISATNDGTDTNVTIGDVASGNYFEVDSANGATIHGDLNVTGNLTVNGTTFSGDDITTNGDLTVAGLTTTDSLSVTNDASIGGNLTVGGDTTMNGDLAVNGALSTFDIGPNYASGLDVDGTSGVSAYAYDLVTGGAAGMGLGSSFMGNGAYIGYTTSAFGGGTMYGLYADASGVGVGYINSSTGASHGLYVTDTHTTLSGGTNSSSLDLADGSATLAVGTISSSEVAVLTATNDGSATDITIDSDTLTINSATTINSTLDVTGNTTIGGTLDVTGAATFNNDLTVLGDTYTNGITNTGNITTDSLTVNNDASVGGNLTVAGNETVSGNLTVYGITNLYDNLRMHGNNINMQNGDIINANNIETNYLTVNNDASVGGDLAVGNDVSVGGDLDVTGNTSLTGTLDVYGTTTLHGATTIDNTLFVTGATTIDDTLTVTGLTTTNGIVNNGNITTDSLDVLANATVGGTLDVNGATTLGSTLTVAGVTTLNGATTINNTLHVTGDTDLDSNLNVDGNTTIGGTLFVSGATTIDDTLTVTGLTTTNGIVNNGNITTDSLDVLANATVGGTLDVTGATTLHSTLLVEGATTIDDTLHVTGDTDLDSNLNVDGNTTIGGTLDVDGLTTTHGIMNVGDMTNTGNITTATLHVTGNSRLDGNVYIDQNLDVDGAINVDGPATLNNTLTVEGVTTLNNYLYVDSNGATAGGNTFVVDDTGIAAAAGAAQLSLDSATGAAALVGTDVTVDGANSTLIEGGSSSIALDNNGVVVIGNTTINDDLTVLGFTTTNGVNNNGNINTDTLSVEGNATVGGTLTVEGATTLNNTLTVAGATTLGSTLTVAGATTINNTLHVTGDTDLDSNLNVDGNTAIGGTLNVTGCTTLHSDLTVVGLTTTHGIVNTEGIYTDTLNTTGDASIGGNLGVTGNLAVTGMTNTHGITNTGALTSTGGDVSLNTDAGNPGNASLRLIDNMSANLLYTNAAGNTHGLTVGESSTVLTGGTTSTSLTLNDGGATFANSSTGAPVRVTGVANGVYDYDAVNMRQLRVYEDAVEKANIGIASVSALAAIPGTMPCKRFAVGAGYGYFEHESAIAIGIKARMWDFLSVQAGIGFGVSDSDDNSYSANAGISYSF